jgi:hypothetical protein
VRSLVNISSARLNFEFNSEEESLVRVVLLAEEEWTWLVRIVMDKFITRV